MLLKARSERDYFVAFIIAIFISFIVNILSQFSWFPPCIHIPTSFLYSFILIAWGASVAQRIVHKRIRRHTIAITNVRSVITAKIYDGSNQISNTFQYSIESYVNNRLQNSDSETFKNLVSEMMKFGISAEEHFS